MFSCVWASFKQWSLMNVLTVFVSCGKFFFFFWGGGGGVGGQS